MFVRHPSGKGYLRLNTDHRASNNSSAAESLQGNKKNTVLSFLIASVDSSPDRWIDRENTWVSQQQLHGTFIKRDRFWNQPARNGAILLLAKTTWGWREEKLRTSQHYISSGARVLYTWEFHVLKNVELFKNENFLVPSLCRDGVTSSPLSRNMQKRWFRNLEHINYYLNELIAIGFNSNS